MKPSPTDLGAEFEDDIAETYQLLGYEVEKDVDIDGQQIDLLLSHNKPGIGKACYIVECKYKSKGKVDNQEVIDFIAVCNALRRSNMIWVACW
jgi:hypothetical protein